MPAAIDPQVKKQVINQWLSGDSRDRIAADNDIGAGTVSNIINEWKKGANDSEYKSIRDLAVFSKKQGLNLIELASRFRLYNYIKKLGANQDQIESFIVNLANSPAPEKLIDVANQVAQLSKSESVPLEDLENHVKQKEEEKQRLEEEIKHRRAILESTNVDVQTISEYTHLKEELSKYRLSTEDPTRLLSILRTIKQIGYDPQKIVARFSYIKSLRQTEKGLKDNCRALEERVDRCQGALPLCERILSMGIGTDKLLPFTLAVNEKARTNNLPTSAAAYRVIEDIENYNRIGGLKKEISSLAMQRYAINQMSAPRDKAITTLLKLQVYGISDEEILNVYEFLIRARFESAAPIRR